MDWWALGILLFEALCGEVPFDGSTEHEVRESLRNGRSRPPRSLRPEVPQELDQLVARCLQPDPTQRYLAAGELRRDLERLAHYRQAPARAGHRTMPMLLRFLGSCSSRDVGLRARASCQAV